MNSLARKTQPRSGSDLIADEQLLDDAAGQHVHQRLTGGGGRPARHPAAPAVGPC